MLHQHMVTIKRIYEPKSSSDGARVLVDRLWPRGVSKEKAALDLWMKEIGPNDSLRKWFNHSPQKWPEFKKRYTQELASKKDLLNELRGLESKHGTLTLLYGARDEAHNQARVIAQQLKAET